MATSQATQRERFWTATKEHEDAVEAAAPLHAQRDAILAKIHALEAELKPIEQAIKRAERPVMERQREIADLSRALGGKVGSRPAA